ncbi:CLUMA_CG006558, isoform A [Clunio marinus]|uniref:CLUMA_CG006558, isoform A n=1 Tax=Clunio marinus TaxID=568069 RepID=A0A1J1HYB5_9DIPT|nr:CLUMA_CG006558, isoform A [Clunio marinus]
MKKLNTNDSRIPKPSGIMKTTSKMFDFNKIKEENHSQSCTEPQKKPLTEYNKSFSSFKFETTSKPNNLFQKSSLRRSRSLSDVRSEPGPAAKRFHPILETIPTKRLRPNPISKSIKIDTLGKRNAIHNTLKAASTSNVVKIVAKKAPIISSTSTFKAKPTTTASKPEPSQPAKTVNKRPAPYDFKARFYNLEEKFKIQKAKFDNQKEQIVSLEEQNELLEKKEEDLVKKLEITEKELSEADGINKQLKLEIEELTATNGQLLTKNTALANSLSSTSEELNELKVKQEKLEKLSEEHEILKIRAENMEQNIANASDQLAESQNKLYSINIERMVLHNMVLDLRGNIRVFARVRPPISNEDDKMACGWSFIDETTLEIVSNEPVAGGRKQLRYDFSFDHVFNPNTTQDEIFEIVSPLIQSALDGYNICIFAYGQTGSGKTFTMDGVEGKLGIIPRTVKLLFDSINSSKILGWNYSITASFLEIYNEVLYDLLSNEDKDIEIRMANAKSKTEIYVSNITQTEVNTAAMLYELMAIARSNRATASTIGNERSSRSHAVTRLEIVGTHPSRPERLVGFINLVDLAGSESPKTSQRMEETKNINRSLSELSNVILALVQKNEHVPYRNSKLTHLLMPCLGGNSKTLMFVNVSPFQENFIESVKSLRFAAQVNSCKVAKAKRNRQLVVNANTTLVGQSSNS